MTRGQGRRKQSKLPKEFLKRLEAVTAKRPKTVINHILKHGHITTEELRDIYGYNHPPRAARDVRERGIPLETFRVTGSDGRRIGAYRFGKPVKDRSGRLGGRKTWPKDFKKQLVERYGSCCEICSTTYEPRYLQIDHRVPFEVAGNPKGKMKTEEFMLLCGSCNRAKSWSCENCENWTADHIIKVCQSCYWATPDNYAHIALELIRRLDIVWKGEEVPEYDRLVKLSKRSKKKLPSFVKNLLNKSVRKGGKV